MSELAKKYNNYLAPEAVIWINGEKLSKRNVFFSDLKVDMLLDGADTFSFTVSDAIDFEFEPKHADLFSFGDTVEIHIGYADSTLGKSMLPILFKGIITAINWNFSEDNYMDISIEGKDYSFLMMKHKYSRNDDAGGGNEPAWNDKTESEAVSEIINSVYKNIFSTVEIEDTAIVHKQIRHKEENDYAFISALAKKNNYEFFAYKDTIYFRKPPEMKNNRGDMNNAITLFYGKEILSFTPEFNVDKQVTKVRVIGVELGEGKQKIVGEAPKTGVSVTGTSSFTMKELLKSINNIEYEIKAPVKSVEEADTLAASVYGDLSSNLLQGEVRSIGIPDLKPGIKVNLAGLGSRFSKEYYISKAVHIINDQGYEVTLNIRSNAFSLNESGGK